MKKIICLTLVLFTLISAFSSCMSVPTTQTTASTIEPATPIFNKICFFIPEFGLYEYAETKADFYELMGKFMNCTYERGNDYVDFYVYWHEGREDSLSESDFASVSPQRITKRQSFFIVQVNEKNANADSIAALTLNPNIADIELYLTPIPSAG